MAAYTIDVKASGPLFDGRGPEAAHEFINSATERLAETGRDWIRIDAMSMNRSGRGGTGRAAAAVEVQTRASGHAIWGGMVEGQVWWPWLEGTSQRNRSTRFRGYHTFRNTRRKLSDYMQVIVAPLLDDFVRKMGGGG